MQDQESALRSVTQALAGSGFDYMVTGSVALGLLAEPRFTNDIDIVIDIKPDRAAELVKALEPDFVVQPEMVELEVSRRGMFNVFHESTIFKIDFIVLRPDPGKVEQFRRRRMSDRAGFPFWIISPEDLVIAKLDWARDSRSEMQLRDIANLLATREDMDLSYIGGWAHRLGLSDLWNEVTDA